MPRTGFLTSSAFEKANWRSDCQVMRDVKSPGACVSANKAAAPVATSVRNKFDNFLMRTL